MKILFSLSDHSNSRNMNFLYSAYGQWITWKLNCFDETFIFLFIIQIASIHVNTIDEATWIVFSLFLEHITWLGNYFLYNKNSDSIDHIVLQCEWGGKKTMGWNQYYGTIICYHYVEQCVAARNFVNSRKKMREIKPMLQRTVFIPIQYNFYTFQWKWNK